MLLIVLCFGVEFFVLFEPYVRFLIFSSGNCVAVDWGLVAHSAYDMFSWYTYLSVSLVFFPPLGLWSGDFFLIAAFPDHCVLVPFYANIDLFLQVYFGDSPCHPLPLDIFVNGANKPIVYYHLMILRYHLGN